ncbi:MAG TPA: thioesterase family protein [Terriglobales bacterium]|nr:thioesterase family protein [Terriglobales bacterium]
MFELDQDTLVTCAADGIYSAHLSDRWSIGHVPNGGYLLAVVMSALRHALPAPDPLAINAHYLRPGTPGPAEVHVEVVKLGRRFSTAAARLVQGGKESLRVLATYGDLSAMEGPTFADAAPPQLGKPPREAPRREPGGMTIRERFDLELDPATTGFLRGERAEHAEIRGWLRFADGRPHDVHALGLIADAFPPAIFQKVEPGWVPTLELTVHVRARPRSPWLAGVFRTRIAQHGLIEEDGELWDQDGTLVAMSRQLALPPRPI